MLHSYVAGLFVAMISEGHVYVLNRGDSVSLECNFHADQYDLFDYPVLWRKTQQAEESQVINECVIKIRGFAGPFLFTGY